MSVWKSEALWTAIVTLIINVVTFIVANYVPDPKMVELIRIIIVGGDSVAAILIAAFTVKDVAAMKYAGITYKQLTAQPPDAIAAEIARIMQP
jgi:hypothetical protein